MAELVEQMRISFQICWPPLQGNIELQDKILDDVLAELGCWK